MNAVSIETRKKKLSQFLVNTFDFAKAVFGLRVVQQSKNGKIYISTTQRILALIWLTVYVIAVVRVVVDEPLEIVLDLDIKNSLIVHILPKISSATSVLTLLLTYILTHVYANERKRIFREVMQICPDLDRGNVDQQRKGINYVIAIGIIQNLYCAYWSFVMVIFTTERALSTSVFVVAALPRVVSACFLVDYALSAAVLLQQFVNVNEKLMQARHQSLETRNYPKSERAFQEFLMDITDRHKALSIIGKRMSQVYSFQLFLNIATMYSLIISSSYIALYALISTFTEEARLVLTFTSVLHLVLNALSFLLVVEITAQLCKEVRDKSC